MKTNNKKCSAQLCVCPYCLQGIESRGEKIALIDTIYDPDVPCDWCGDYDDELTVIEFK